MRPRAASRRLALLLPLLLAGAVAAQVRPGSEQGPVYPHEIVPVDAIRGHLMEGVFREPVGLCYDAAHDELFVADGKNGLIGIYDRDGVPLFTFGGPRLLTDPKHVEVGEDGTIYVLDAVQTQVKVFSYRGEPKDPLVFTYPETDTAEAGTARVGSFTLGPEGRFYVADLDLPQVLVYDPELHLERIIRPVEGQSSFSAISGLAVSAQGLLAVVDFKATPVQVFDREGRFLLGFGAREIAREDFTAPIAVAFDGEGFLFVVDMLRHDVKIFTLDGKFAGSFGGWFSPETGGRSPGEMLYPTDIALAPEGRLYVAERFGNRVQIFDRRPRGERPSRPRLPLPEVGGGGGQGGG